MTKPLVWVVLLNWNRKEDTAECIESLLRSHYESLEILVVDNGSIDGSATELAKRFPQVTMLTNDQNLGFAAGSNVGLRWALEHAADYVLLLNNDTVVDSDMVAELVAAGEASEQFAVLVPKIYYYGATGTIWSIGARRRWLPPRVTVKGLNYRETAPLEQLVPVDYATGCAMAIKRAVLDKVGFLDEGYFMYCEDYDFCERVRKSGFKLACVQKAVLWHKVATSTAHDSRMRWYHLAASSVRFYRAHWRPALPLLAIYSLWVLCRELAKGNPGAIPPYTRGLFATNDRYPAGTRNR